MREWAAAHIQEKVAAERTMLAFSFLLQSKSDSWGLRFDVNNEEALTSYPA